MVDQSEDIPKEDGAGEGGGQLSASGSLASAGGEQMQKSSLVDEPKESMEQPNLAKVGENDAEMIKAPEQKDNENDAIADMTLPPVPKDIL